MSTTTTFKRQTANDDDDTCSELFLLVQLLVPCVFLFLLPLLLLFLVLFGFGASGSVGSKTNVNGHHDEPTDLARGVCQDFT